MVEGTSERNLVSASNFDPPIISSIFVQVCSRFYEFKRTKSNEVMLPESDCVVLIGIFTKYVKYCLHSEVSHCCD